MIPELPGPLTLPRVSQRWLGVSGQEQPTENQPAVGGALTACSQHVQAALKGSNQVSHKYRQQETPPAPPSQAAHPLETLAVPLPSYWLRSLEAMILFQPLSTQGHKKTVSLPSTLTFCPPPAHMLFSWNYQSDPGPCGHPQSLTLGQGEEQQEATGNNTKPGAQLVLSHGSR